MVADDPTPQTQPSEPEPLHVRCARALGCKPFRCEWPNGIVTWQCECTPAIHRQSELPLAPYGEESPASWACTGPLIARFGLMLVVTDGKWSAVRPRPRFGGGGGGNDQQGMWTVGPCAAIAEWVAQHGARA